MSYHIYTRVKNIWRKFSNPSYRYAFVLSNISTTVAAQIETMRNDRGWTQAQLAEAAGMRQSRISVLEDPSNTSVNIKTLTRIAKACDVALMVQFVPFSRVARWSAESSITGFSVPSFSEDGIGSSQVNIFLDVTTKGSRSISLIEAKATSQPVKQYIAKTPGEQIYVH